MANSFLTAINCRGVARNALAIICLLAVTALFTCEQPPDYCSRGIRYDPDIQFCAGGEAHKFCACGSKYNPLSEGCDPDNNTLSTKCADGSYVKLGHQCGGYTLSTAVAPADGGTITRSSDKPKYEVDDEVTLTAIAQPGYEFAGWAGASEETGVSVTIQMTKNQPLVAMFNPKSDPGASEHTLVTTAFPENGGTVSPSGISIYSNGASVAVTATAAAGYTFSGWSGASTARSSPVTITMNSGKTLVAMFTPIVYTLTVNANPQSGGAVFVNGTALVGAAPQDAGTQVEVLAQAAEGYVFAGWSGMEYSNINPVMINITSGNQTLTANFRKDEGGTIITPTIYNLTYSVNPPNCGSINLNPAGTGSGSPRIYSANAIVSASVNAVAGCTFTGWTGDASGIGSVSITMNADKSITANFTGSPSGGIVGDSTLSYGGQNYRTVIMPDGKRWMAENLNFVTSRGSWCYGEDSLSATEVQDNCAKYGRLYDWAAVMNLPESCNYSECANQALANPQGICPVGWRVPTRQDWDDLIRDVGSQAGTKLKSQTGWNTSDGYIPGTDQYGFSALPGGRRWSGSFYHVGFNGGWWSAAEYRSEFARYRGMDYDGEYVYDVYEDWIYKSLGFSARCLRD